MNTDNLTDYQAEVVEELQNKIADLQSENAELLDENAKLIKENESLIRQNNRNIIQVVAVGYDVRNFLCQHFFEGDFEESRLQAKQCYETLKLYFAKNYEKGTFAVEMFYIEINDFDVSQYKDLI